MTTNKNFGKIFEESFKSSVLNCEEKIFFFRIKDVNVPPDLRNRVKLVRNDYDCLMFTSGHLFTLELKSTKEKSISFSESIIKQHQIDNLLEASTHNGVISGFLFNFREPENRLFFIHIRDFIDYQMAAQRKITNHKYRAKINKSSIPISICEEIGIEIKSTKMRVNYKYNIKEFVKEALLKYES
ncbi:Holliday junction resolvase RecU [Paenibacillus pini]|uniref:Holliday junction resolvase RecU n=1 Tax=Paenibacillus pini TaxID=669461 RepID=UPI0005629775|nr:Holliday junction resolvase RecU [Paenibacillus pini]